MRTLIAIIPAIQLGFSWWVTVSLFSCLWLIIEAFRKRRYASITVDAILLCTLAGMLISVSINPSSDTRDLLRVLREGLILFLLMQLANNFTAKSFQFSENYHKTLIYVSLFQICFCSVQYLFLLRGRYVSLPYSFYGDRASTLPDMADLKYSYIRPAGTFSEPSYLALVCLGLVICALNLKGKSQYRILIIGCNSATILLSQSKLGYFGLISILLVTMSSKSLRQRVRFFHYFLVILMASFSYVLLQILSYQAGSSYVNRIRIPWQIIPDFIQNNPFGLPFYVRTLKNTYTKGNFFWADILHNSIYNIIFSYGLVSILVLFLIYFNFRRRPLMILFATLALVQNGSFLDFDKLLLVSLVSILSKERISWIENVDSPRI